MADPVRVFVSHHHSTGEDRFTTRLVSDLRSAGADVWVDSDGIASDDFVRKISEGLTGRQWLILVMTPASVASHWVQREVNAALNEQTAGRMLGVIPFVMTRCNEPDIPLLWRNLHRYDATQSYEAARDRLFQTLRLQMPPALQAPRLQPATAWSLGFSRVVDRGGTGNYQTISEAINAASPNERILIRKGIYAEQIIINKPLELIGDGQPSDVVIRTAISNITLYFQATRGRLANLSIQQLSKMSNCNALVIREGQLEVEGCDLSSTRGHLGATISGRDTNLHMQHSHIHHAGTGILVEDGTALIEDCDVLDNQGEGITVANGAPTVRRCHINRNGGWAILIGSLGGGIFEDNDLRGNQKGAWYISQGRSEYVARRRNLEE